MKRKKTNIKIKHRKFNLYNRKKSKAKQALAVILTIAAAAALCVVGYGLGKPLTEYFKNRDNVVDSGSAWTPPATAETSGGNTPDATAEATAESAEAAKPASTGAYILPDNCAASSDSLNSAIAAAKSGGYGEVVVTLKDSTGYFLYKSEIEGIKDSDAIHGTLTASRVCSLIKEAGLTPKARIYTLEDHVCMAYVEGIRYLTNDGWAWHDDRVESGGRQWISPFNRESAEFVADITSELSSAGFETIILSGTMYPMFHPTDYALLDNIADNNQRVAALWSVIDSASSAARANGAEVLLETDGTALFADEKLSTTAEPASDKERLKSAKILADFTLTDQGNAYIEAKSFTGRMNGLFPSQEYAVLIAGSGFSETTLEQAVKAFSESGISVYVR